VKRADAQSIIQPLAAQVKAKFATKTELAALRAEVAQLKARDAERDKRLKQLESRSWLEYRDVWKADVTYRADDAVTWDGCMWVARAASTNARPGRSECWRLAVKKGRDGKDLRNDHPRYLHRLGVEQ
jgi:hypothetical protein